MNIEEAIIDIKECIKPIVGGISLDMAIEALDKQLPKKVLREMEECEGQQLTILKCPSCGHSGTHWDLRIYYNTCGQKLDWTE